MSPTVREKGGNMVCNKRRKKNPRPFFFDGMLTYYSLSHNCGEGLFEMENNDSMFCPGEATQVF